MVTPSDSGVALPTVSASTTPPPVDPAIAALIADIKPSVELIQAFVAAIKTKGVAGGIETAVNAVPLVTKEIGDVKAAIPAFKKGFQTSEGQLALGYAVVSEGIAFFAPHLPDWALPLNSVIVGLVITAYGYFRTRTKVAHVTAVATVATAQPATAAKP
jgi:hypothetical protein